GLRSVDWRLRGPWSDSRQDDRHRLTRPCRARATRFCQERYSIMCLAPTRASSRPSSMTNEGGFDRSPAGGERLLFACAVRRRRFPVGASPTRRTLQPEATGAVMEVTKWLKPSVAPVTYR